MFYAVEIWLVQNLTTSSPLVVNRTTISSSEPYHFQPVLESSAWRSTRLLSSVDPCTYQLRPCTENNSPVHDTKIPEQSYYLIFQADAEDICTILRKALQLVYSKPPPQSSTPAAPVQRRQTNKRKGT